MSTVTLEALRTYLPDQQWKRDVLLIVGAVLGVYVLFGLVGLALGFGANGIANTLRRITFLAAVYALLVLALNLHWGYTGLFNIGVAGFMAVGVYTMAIMTAPADASVPGFGLPLWIGVIAGMIAAALVGLVAALPALRLRADYLAIVTLGLSEIIRLTFQSRWLSDRLEETVGVGYGGGSGMGIPTNPTVIVDYLFFWGGDPTGDPTPLGTLAFSIGELLEIQRSVIVGWGYVFVLLGFVAVFYWLLVRIGNSPFGRVLKAIREDEVVADSLGKDTRLFKIKVFMLGCALMGLAGILWQGSQGFTSPREFMPLLTFYVFIALIIGGAGSNTGSVLGGVFFAAILFEGPPYVPRLLEAGLGRAGLSFGPEPSTFYDAVTPLAALDVLPMLAYADGNISMLRFVLLGVVLILVIQRRPDGLLGHRTETASSVDLSIRPGPTAGGERDE